MAELQAIPGGIDRTGAKTELSEEVESDGEYKDTCRG